MSRSIFPVLSRYLLAILLVGIVFTTGCSQDSNAQKKMVLLWWGDIYNAPFGQKLVDAYNATCPEVQVELMPVDKSGYSQKIMSMAASNSLPDMVLMTTREAMELGSRGVFLGLNRYTASPGFSNISKDIWPGLLGNVTYKGRIMAMPIWTWAPAIYYNKDIFDAGMVEYPSRDWTWEEFAAKGRKLTRKENRRAAIFGIDDMSRDFDNTLLLSYLYGHGGRLYSPDLLHTEIDKPETVAALRSYLDLATAIAPAAADKSSMETQGLKPDYFQAGKTAMLVGGRDYMDVLRQGGCKLRWGVAPLPVGKTGRHVFLISAYIGISGKTCHPDAAWKFLSFAAGEKGQKIIARERSDIAVMRKWTTEKEFMSYQGRPDVNAVFRDALVEAKPAPFTLGKDKWKAFARNELALVVMGKRGLDEACKEISDKFNQ